MASFPGAVPWAPWDAAAFERATRARQPIFLYVFVTWSEACAYLDTHVFADERLQRLLADAFVCVRVDADLRPDISERYSLGGWPALFVLTPDGDVLTGGQNVSPAGLTHALLRVLDAFQARGDDRPAPPPDVRDASQDTASSPSSGHEHASPSSVDLSGWIRRLEAFDEGDLLGTPMVIDVSLAMMGARPAAADTLGASVERLVDRTVEQLLDSQSGAVFRPRGGGESPERIALLGTNAGFSRTLLEASQLIGQPRWQMCATRVLDFVRAHMTHPVGGFVHACRPDPSMATHVVDPRRFVEANARMASALLAAGRILRDASLAELGVATLEHVLGAYQRGAGLPRTTHEELPSMVVLDDQVVTAAALVDAYDDSGMRVYLDIAEELMRFALRTFWDDDRQALVDIVRPPAPPAVGLLAEPLVPAAGNSLAVRVLWRLSARTGDSGLRERARHMVSAWTHRHVIDFMDEVSLLLAAIEVAP